MSALTADKKRLETLANERVRPLLASLAPIPSSEWLHFARKLRLYELRRGETLTQAGAVANAFAFVVDGALRKVHVTARGRRVVRGFAGPSELAGAYASLLSREPSHLSVDAVVDSTLIVMSWLDFTNLYARHACWQAVGRRIAEDLFLERETRAHELLTLTASERYRAFCQKHRGLLPLLRQYDIASYLGITPVSLSRLRARRAK